MNKVEQVARALAERNIRVARRWDTEPAKLEEMMPAAIEHNWRELIPEAIAAIKAMREPTQQMRRVVWEQLEASAKVGNLRSGHIAGDGHPDVLLRKMIDAALSEAGETNEQQ